MSEPDARVNDGDAAIRTRALTKRYGKIEAVRGIELDVGRGEIFGLIGPDGAGKTSTFQILGGVMEASSGNAERLGRPARQAREYVGYLTQAFSLYPDLSVAENLRYVGELRRVPLRDIRARGERYLTMFGMERFTDRLAGRLSGGMKQKLALACALVAEPRILLLDEPTTGVDPVSRREFWDALAQLSGQGITILLATPYLDEAERCHRVALMHEGRLHQVGTPAELRQSLGLQRLEVHYGEVYGLLGANGAGKTTTIKMLCGLLEPSAGEVQLAGEVGALRSENVRQQVGYMSQKFSLYDDLTINENLDFFAGVYRVPPERRAARKRWVLEFAGLGDRGGQITGSLPGGWKQRVAFGAAIMHEPRVLFLDEPTSGVDPIARRAFWAMINQLADQGTAILVTTHYLEEAEQCNRLGFMVAGELVAEGTPSGVKAAHGGRVLEVLADDPQRAVAVLKTELEPWRVSLFGDRLHVIVEGDAQAAARDLAARLAREGIQVREAREEDYSLEDVFLVIAEKGVVAA